MDKEIKKKGQEEMVGFALIVILVAVIGLVFLAFSLNKHQSAVESYQAESFVQSVIQYTTQCKDYYGFVSVGDLVSMCQSGSPCVNDGSDSCQVLNSTLKGILDTAWPVGKGSPYKGYSLEISSNNAKTPILVKAGNVTSNSEGAIQPFPVRNGVINVTFVVYS